jgi:hypothetical protein
MPCDHPAASLKAEDAEQSPTGKLKVTFCCLGCLCKLTKEFLTHVPEQPKPAEQEITDLLKMAPPIEAPAELEPRPKVKRGANSPWRTFTGAQPT